jgi:hypothetical protein
MLYYSDFYADLFKLATLSPSNKSYIDRWNSTEDYLNNKLSGQEKIDVLKEAYEITTDCDASAEDKLAANVLISMMEV